MIEQMFFSSPCSFITCELKKKCKIWHVRKNIKMWLKTLLILTEPNFGLPGSSENSWNIISGSSPDFQRLFFLVISNIRSEKLWNYSGKCLNTFNHSRSRKFFQTSHQRGTDNYQGSLNHLKSIQYYFKLKIFVYYFLKPSDVCREDRESTAWGLISSLWCNVEKAFLQDKGNIFITETLLSRGECLQLMFSFSIFVPTLKNKASYDIYFISKTLNVISACKCSSEQSDGLLWWSDWNSWQGKPAWYHLPGLLWAFDGPTQLPSLHTERHGFEGGHIYGG